MHRKAKLGHTLCGKSISNDSTTLDDTLVTCEKCRDILKQFDTSAMMKTSIIRKFVDNADDENDRNGRDDNEHDR